MVPLKTYRFGRVLYECRTEQGITLERLSKVIGSSKGYLSGIENLKVHPPRPQMIAKICRVLGIDQNAMQVLAFVDKSPSAVHEIESFKKFAEDVEAIVKRDVFHVV